MELSIIVPIYNVENYIRDCIESIFKQGLDNNHFEIIIVNDGTKDKSIEVIQDIIKAHSNIIVINQNNQGLSVARNNGMSKAKGQFILFLDSDDLLFDKALLPIINKALETKADLLVADFIKLNDNDIFTLKDYHLPPKKFEIHEKTNERFFLEDLDPNQCYVWRTLYRKDFLINNKIFFYPHVCYEDILFTHECFIKAKKCMRTHWLLNIYRKRENSITTTFNKNKAKDLCIIIGKTWELRKSEGLSQQSIIKLENNVYTLFNNLIYIIVKSMLKHADKIEIIDFLKATIPDLYFTNNYKKRIESYLFTHLPHFYLMLRELHWKWVQVK